VRRLILLVAVLPSCAVEASDPECPGLGCPGDSGAGTVSTMPGSSSASSSTATATATGTGDEASSGDGSAATSATSGTQASSAAEASTSTGAPCEGESCPALAECFGLGVWQSCNEYCTALKATCVEAGCGGATVVYYNDVDDCVAMAASGESPQACDDGFDQGGGLSFGRCCCE
jgi:hypothetical protein